MFIFATKETSYGKLMQDPPIILSLYHINIDDLKQYERTKHKLTDVNTVKQQ